jgi:hypothetical protein
MVEGRMRRFLQLGIISLLTVPASAGVHPAEVENRLAFIVGDWTVGGSDAVYSDNCQWFDDDSFVICDTRDARKGELHHSIAVLGYSAATANFTYQQYDNNGRGRNETCFANDQGGITCLGERRDGAQLTQTRSYIWPNTGGLGIRQEKSTNAGPWSDVGQVQYVKRKAGFPAPQGR